MNAALNFNAEKLLNAGNGVQFNDHLTSLRNSERKKDDTSRRARVDEEYDDNGDNDDDDDDDDEEGGDDDVDDDDNCLPSCHCGKSCKQPNKLMEEKLSHFKERLKDRSQDTKHFLRDDYVYSRNLNDYLIQSVYVFDPLKMMKYSKKLVCWNKDCAGHKGDRNYDDIINLTTIDLLIICTVV